MKSCVFLSFIVFCATQSVAAQEDMPLTLSDAIAIAVSTNPRIEAAHYAEIVAWRNRKAAAGLRMPTISLSGNFTHLGKDVAIDANHLKAPLQSAASDLIGFGIENNLLSPQTVSLLKDAIEPFTSADWSLTLQKRNLAAVGGEITIPVYTGGRINAANHVARIEEEVAQQTTAQVSNSLLSEVVTRYFGLALSAQAIEVRRAAADGIRRHLEDAIALEQSGMIPRSERLYMEYRMAQAERELKDSELQHLTLTHALSTTLAERSNRYLPTTSMFIVDSMESVTYFKQAATHANPLLTIASLQLQMADEGVKAERADYLPQVAVVGAGSIFDYQLSDALPRWAIGIGVNIKLFDGLARENRYAASKARVRYAERLEEDALNEIMTLIEKLYNELQNSYNQVISLQASIVFAEEYLHDIEIAFKEGIASATELIDAELNLSKARIERIEAAYTYDVRLAQLLEASGISGRYLDYCFDGNARQIMFDTAK